MIAVTHVLFALTLAYLFRLPVMYAVVAGLLPNVDALFAALFPFTPQGILHTPLFAAFVTVVLYLVTDRKAVALAAGLGLLSHLLLDTLTPLGAMWLYPVTTHHIAVVLFPATDLLANMAIGLYSVGVLVVWRYRREVGRWIRM